MSIGKKVLKFFRINQVMNSKGKTKKLEEFSYEKKLL